MQTIAGNIALPGGDIAEMAAPAYSALRVFAIWEITTAAATAQLWTARTSLLTIAAIEIWE